MKKKSCKVIIGSSFGDEGKGFFTDHLCSLSPDKSIVVRFNGGHQAAHHVDHGIMKHTFSNFGSGTLRGVPTYWSKYCTVDPVGLMKELFVLKEWGLEPKLFIDSECSIVTPYDIEKNILKENINNHGSVGVGFGSTIDREENHYSLKVIDLFYDSIFTERVKNIELYYGIELDISEFIESCVKLIKSKNIEIIYDIPKDYNYIFEGAQGLLLDQNYGFFPNVTRSNTGCKNVVEMLGHDSFEIYLITRAYHTRHGNGFMNCLEKYPNNIKNKDETNKDHPYQGKFRTSILDVSMLEYAFKRDLYIRNSKNKKLVITCLDHIENEYRFLYNNLIINCLSREDFVKRIFKILEIREVYYSFSKNSDNIRRMKI